MRAVIADDDRLTTTILSTVLQQCGVDVDIAHDGVGAWQLLQSEPRPSLAILDWMMPGLSGPELCKRIRNTAALSGLYVILLTARDKRQDLIKGLGAGADDYMVKPIWVGELHARVRVAMRVAGLQERLADRVRELQGAHDYMAKLISTDALTGVFSRRAWFERAGCEFARSRRHGRSLSVMMIDIDHFKRVNDQFGHAIGDQLLVGFADALRSTGRQSDVVGRLGGEEFALLAPEISSVEAGFFASRILAASRNVRVETPSGSISCTCSIGITDLAAYDENIDSVLKRADLALYDSKRAGRDRWTNSTPLEISA
jgi:two-component system, cell cycle response regulator